MRRDSGPPPSMRTIFPESETRGIMNFEDVPLTETTITVDDARVSVWVLPPSPSSNEIRAVAAKTPGLLVLLRGAGFRKAVPAELPAEAVLAVVKVDNLQAALFDADRKLALL